MFLTWEWFNFDTPDVKFWCNVAFIMYWAHLFLQFFLQKQWDLVSWVIAVLQFHYFIFAMQLDQVSLTMNYSYLILVFLGACKLYADTESLKYHEKYSSLKVLMENIFIKINP